MTPEQLQKRLRRLEKTVCCNKNSESVSSPFLPLLGTGTATGNIIGDLNNNELSIQYNGENSLSISSNMSQLRATHVFGELGTGEASLAAIVGEGVGFFLHANFNGGDSYIAGGAGGDPSSTIEYGAEIHLFKIANTDENSFVIQNLDGSTKFF